MMRKSTTRIFSNSLKVAIVFFALFYIARKLVMHSEDRDLLRYFSEAFSGNYAVWILVLALAVVNWSIEALRWKFLVSRIENISWQQSVKAVLAGVTLGVATPNRIGEFGARIFYLEKADRVQAALLAFAGSFAQFMVTAFAGFAGMMFLGDKLTKDLFGNRFVLMTVVGVMLVMILIFASLIFFETIRILFSKLKPFQRWNNRLEVFGMMNAADHLKLFGLSLLRYAVYSLQFYLVLFCFGIKLSPAEGFAAIAVTYFVITVVPTFALTEVIVRGTAATAVIGAITQGAQQALAASVAIWIINIVLPALIGTASVFRLRFFRKNNSND